MQNYHVQARALILSFQDTDLTGLSEENNSVHKSLQDIGFDVQTLEFECQNYKRKLKAFLNGARAGPRVIYISGHGGETCHGELELSGRYGGKIIEWPTILDFIGAAECDVLVILDCCSAGLAGATGLEHKHNQNFYSKELITASDWGTAAYNGLAQALCEALPTWRHKNSDRQGSSLHHALLKAMKGMRDAALREIDQAEQEGFNNMKRQEATLKGLNKKLEVPEAKMDNEAEKHGGARRKGQARDQQWESLRRQAVQVENMIWDAEARIGELRSTQRTRENERKTIRARHPQPHYSKLNPKAAPWTLKGGYYFAGKGSD